MFKDFVNTLDAGIAFVKDKANRLVDSRLWVTEATIVEYKGWVRCLMRERGKIVPGSLREGHNIWTNSGREYDALKRRFRLSLLLLTVMMLWGILE
jgi:hypothetical protein